MFSGLDLEECIQLSMIVVIMGVAGAGKTTVGTLLAQELKWPFYDGDDFHPQTNIDKMANSVALTDEDRTVWLHSLHTLIHNLIRADRSAVVACSALKKSYRQLLVGGRKEVQFVYLRGGYPLIKERLLQRQSHFMPATLLASQFEALEEPQGILTIEISQSPNDIVRTIRAGLGL